MTNSDKMGIPKEVFPTQMTMQRW